MRIISGVYKGKKLISPLNKETRPLKDLTKESLFNIINHSNKFNINIQNSNVLDLFSGIGSFGIECLSRGAKFVMFVESYQDALDVLKKNLFNLKLVKNYEMIKKNIYEELNFNSFNKKFNIIFLDPPYKDKNINLLLKKIYNAKILEDNGILIIHRHKNDDNFLIEQFNIIEKKKYGISKIIFGNYFWMNNLLLSFFINSTEGWS